MQLEIKADVSDGVITGAVNLNSGLTFSANINDSGRFYVEMPKESTYTIAGRERFGAYESHVFKGNLNSGGNSGAGFYIDALGSMAIGGCRYPIT